MSPLLKEENGPFEVVEETGLVIPENVQVIFSSDEWIKKVGKIPHLPGGSGQLLIEGEVKNPEPGKNISPVLPVNPQPPSGLEEEDTVAYLDWFFEWYNAGFILFISFLILCGLIRHKKTFYYLNPLLALDFIRYIFDFSSARKRKNSDSGYTSVDMKSQMAVEAAENGVSFFKAHIFTAEC